jgi:hypothetical protein
VTRLKSYCGKLAMKLPGVRGKIEEEMQTLGETLEKNFYKDIRAVGYTVSLPEEGMSGEQVLEAIQAQVNLGTSYNIHLSG